MSIPRVSDVQEVLEKASAKWRATPNQLTEVEDDAQRLDLLGVRVPRDLIAQLMKQPRPTIARMNLPAAIDWRQVNGANHISPVKDQGACGSCVSFCCCGLMESMVSISGGGIVDLSEADLHFCSAHGANCGGWWPSDALGEAQNRGVPTEDLFPYESAFQNGTPSCHIHPDRDGHLYRPTGSSTLVSMDERKEWLATHGPVSAVLHIYGDFYGYRSGVYQHVTGDHQGYHCVEVIGYSDQDRCWIAKNSWGPAWGDGGFFRIGYGECGIDDTSNDRDPDGSLNRFPMYGVTGMKMPGGWKGFELAPAGSAAVTGAITSVSRIPNSMENWWVAPDGSVQAAYWYEGGQWSRYQLSDPGSASPNGGMASVSRIPNSMENWWVAPDGSVQGAYWYEGGQWGRYQLSGPGSASLNTGVAAVSRIPGSMENWWVAPDGSVQGAYWYEGGQWGRYQVSGPGSASTDTGVAAVSRIPGSMEIWWVAPDGSVQGAYWYEGGQWGRYQVSGPGSASPKAGITAVSRIANSMENWWVAPDGSVQAAYWYEGGQWTRYGLKEPGQASGQGGITVVSRIPGSMEAWWIGANGSVGDAYWYE